MADPRVVAESSAGRMRAAERVYSGGDVGDSPRSRPVEIHASLSPRIVVAGLALGALLAASGCRTGVIAAPLTVHVDPDSLRTRVRREINAFVLSWREDWVASNNGMLGIIRGPSGNYPEAGVNLPVFLLAPLDARGGAVFGARTCDPAGR